jgi:hypothetical protein
MYTFGQGWGTNPGHLSHFTAELHQLSKIHVLINIIGTIFEARSSMNLIKTQSAKNISSVNNSI